MLVNENPPQLIGSQLGHLRTVFGAGWMPALVDVLVV
jgi:hypothetical protein